MFDSYKQFTRIGSRKRQAKSGDMKRYEKYIRRYVIVNYDHIVRETERAALFVISHQQHWLPKSQITIYAVNKTIEIPLWMATERALPIQKQLENNA